MLLFPSDRTRMPLNHAEMITSRTPTCRWVGFFLEILNVNFVFMEIVSFCTCWLLLWLLWLLFPEVRKIPVIQYYFELSFSEAIYSRWLSLSICSECYDKLVSFLLYWFRVTMMGHVSCHWSLLILKLFPILLVDLLKM